MAAPNSHENVSEQNIGKNADGSLRATANLFDSEDERRRYLIADFPGLVRTGKFVEAMEAVQGNGRFNWFYGLVDMFGKWMNKRAKPETAGMAENSETSDIPLKAGTRA